MVGFAWRSVVCFIQASYFRLLFIIVLVIPLIYAARSLAAIVASEVLAEYIKDFSNFSSYESGNLPARLLFVVYADLLLILAGTLFFAYLRNFLDDNARAISEFVETNYGNQFLSWSGRLSSAVAVAVLLLVAWMLLLPHLTYTWTLVVKTTTNETCATLPSIGALPANLRCLLSDVLGNQVRAFSLAVNLAAIVLSISLLSLIALRRARFLEQAGLVVLAIIAVTALLIHLFTFYLPVQTSFFLGPFGLVMMFYAVVVGMLAAFLNRRTVVPLLAFVGAMAVGNTVLSYASTRAMSPPPESPAVAFPVESREYAERFVCRYARTNARRDATNPIFIVTAEGGGFYAAYFSAMVLASLDARYPELKSRIFGMSGVSGGGLGVSIASKTWLLPAAERQRIVSDFFAFDFLTPVIASLAFVDSRRVFGVASASRHRAYALEKGFERSWDNAVTSVPSADGWFAQGFFDLKEGEVPVVLNAVIMNSGLPLLISPLSFTVTSEALNAFANYQDLVEATHLPTSTAIGLGARFPYVTPGALLPVKPSRRGHDILVGDGGYFDNTGMATGILMAEEVRRTLSRFERMQSDCAIPRPTIKFIRIRASFPLGTDRVEASPPDELIAPILALYGVREAQRDQLGYLAQRMGYEVIDLSLFDKTYDYPLTWKLSAKSKKLISERIEKILAATGPDAMSCCGVP